MKSTTGNNISNKRLFQKVKEIKLPIGKYALFGSAPMGARGLKKCGDIDLIVDDEIWEEYKNKPGWNYQITENGVEHIESDDSDIEIWHDWRPWYQTARQFIDDTEIIDDLPFVKLTYVLEWKKKWGREKDMGDIEIIEKYLRNKE